ncbi:hypothetical protein [Thioalkalivibrio thiocyanodenitrificans]|uniref:hypothetical protein n=1 Tax=Thioalkalivibrio thiocyanodenitrificans TaxID=243063 RepID=UPI00035DB7A2|nr:hypothetical protein [Thioalkalivibrio thiocyanodenitrificans]
MITEAATALAGEENLFWPLVRNARVCYRLDLAILTPSNNTLRGMHYMAYRKLRRAWASEILVALNMRLPSRPIAQALLEVHRYSSGELDWDNALGGLKVVQDCLVRQTSRNPDGLGLIVDDCPKYMPEPPYMRQLEARRNQGRSHIFIYELLG